MEIGSRKPGRSTPLRDDYEMAHLISVVGCGSCACGSITVRLHDQYGAVFAAATFGAKVAGPFVDELRELVYEQSKSGGLGGLPTEGNA